MKAGARKTVLLITPGGRSAPGGITRMADYCVRSWPAESAFTLRVIDTYGPGSKLLMPFFALKAFLVTAFLIATGKAQLLHVNLSERLSLWRKGAFVLLGNWLGVPVIIHLHGAEFGDYISNGGPRRRRFASGLLRRARKLIVLGSYWREFLIRELNVSPDKIMILCNAVPDMGSRRIGAHHEECLMVFLGVLGERKGVPTLLKALALQEMRPLRWRMIVAGNGPAEVYQDMAAEFGIATRVQFPGLLAEQEARSLLEQADIFVLPSRREGLPMAVLEAMSYGCPVVATDVGSIPDAVVNGQTGLLVPVDDAPALSHALARLAGDNAYRERLGLGARKAFGEKFSITVYNYALEEIYAHATRAAASPAAYPQTPHQVRE